MFKDWFKNIFFGIFFKNKGIYRNNVMESLSGSSKKYGVVLAEKYANLSNYNVLVDSFKSKTVVYTNTAINYLPEVGFGDDVKSVKARLGMPNTKADNVSKYDLTILFYKIFIGGQKCKIEFHFYKNALFYFQLNFTVVNEDEKSKILDVIQHKYGEQIDYTNQIFNNKETGYAIMVTPNINLRIHYLDLKGEFVNELGGYSIYKNYRYLRSKERKINELYSKL